MEQQNQALREALVNTMLEFRRVKPAIQMVCGLPAGEFFFLQRIHELSCETEVRVSRLRDAMCMTMPAVSQFLRTLEEKGLIRRETSPTDRRVTLVSVTEKGKDILDESQKQFNQMLDKLIEQYGPNDLEQLIYMLKRLSGTIQELRGEFEEICNERTECT
ncbi:MAG TPA: MarR family transcriptional regulator [Candidatus Gallacutalibacter pullistercoris]|nr:MarR family transcriptional regulator [Candidatus Gallacutalibacter pullistercoris]